MGGREVGDLPMAGCLARLEGEPEDMRRVDWFAAVGTGLGSRNLLEGDRVVGMINSKSDWGAVPEWDATRRDRGLLVSLLPGVSSNTSSRWEFRSSGAILILISPTGPPAMVSLEDWTITFLGNTIWEAFLANNLNKT